MPGPGREEGICAPAPGTTITIDSEQRDGLYELVRNHLGSVGDLFVALERDKDFATAERLGFEFAEDFRLLQDIGWGEDDDRTEVEQTILPHDLIEVLQAPPRPQVLSAAQRPIKTPYRASDIPWRSLSVSHSPTEGEL